LIQFICASEKSPWSRITGLPCPTSRQASSTPSEAVQWWVTASVISTKSHKSRTSTDARVLVRVREDQEQAGTRQRHASPMTKLILQCNVRWGSCSPEVSGDSVRAFDSGATACSKNTSVPTRNRVISVGGAKASWHGRTMAGTGGKRSKGWTFSHPFPSSLAPHAIRPAKTAASCRFHRGKRLVAHCAFQPYGPRTMLDHAD